MSKKMTPNKEAIMKRYREIHQEMVVEARPYLLPFLKRLKIINGEKLRVGRAYRFIFECLSREINNGRKKEMRINAGGVRNYYMLWANGVPIDFLRGLTKKQAHKMWKEIEAKGKK